MGVIFSQFFPPKPTLTEANLPSQKGKVFIVTGGASGSTSPAAQKQRHNPQSRRSKLFPRLHPVFLSLHLDDLTTIKPAVKAFTAKESKLDVLFNNAGVSLPPPGSLSAQGHELQIATNCLGPYLLTQLLLPTLLHTAESAPPAAVRMIWTSSIVVDLSAPKGGINISDLTTPPPDQQKNYATSKTGNWFLASALAAHVGSKGILSVTQNPGNLKTSLLRHAPWILGFVTAPLLYSAKMGAYTELWAGLSKDLRIGDGGKYVLPWGRLHPSPRPDLLAALRTGENEGTGVAALFVEYCEKQTAESR